jgi:Zn-finger nucleic acid-binding protein
MKQERKTMADFKIMCPKCFAMVVTAHPEAMIWERCPACRRHVWETYDLMMAEVVVDRGHCEQVARIM